MWFPLLRTCSWLVAFAVPGLCDGAELEDRLAHAAQQGAFERIVALLGEVGPSPSDRMVRLLLTLGVETPSGPVYAAVRKAFQAVRREDSFAVLAKVLATQKDFRYRAFAATILGENPAPATVGSLLPFLKDKDRRIALTVAGALGSKPHRDGVECLIGALAEADKVPGEFSLVIRRSLYRLTGMNLATASDWAKWWQTRKATWQPDVGESSASPTSPPADVRPPGTFPSFFGVEIYSLNVVFVIDISESMSEPSRGSEKPKIDMVKEELIRLIHALRPETRFCVVAFNDTIAAHAKTLVPATPAEKARAVRFTRELIPRGFTWTQEALEKAFSYADANTMVFLSDGSPYKKNHAPIPTQPILDWVAQVNRFRQVTIHCVGFRDAFAPFIRTLAWDNGGTYVNAGASRPAE
jgi:hypothetical protein